VTEPLLLRRPPFAVKVLLLERALDLVPNLVFLLAEAGELGSDLLLDVSVEGFLTRGGDGGRGGGLGLELGNKGGVELCLVKGQ
jgi:hypothetical protein